MTNEDKLREIFPKIIFLQHKESDKLTALVCSDEWLNAEYQEPKSEWEHDHEILKAYSDGANEVLDKIRAEIWDLQYGDEEKGMTNEDRADAYNNAVRQVIEIIDKYKAESEG